MSEHIKKSQKPLLTILRRSCLTNKAVWLYRGHGTRRYAAVIYCHACSQEEERQYQWGKLMAQRQSYIIHQISELLAGQPLSMLTQEQQSAVHEMQSIAMQTPQPDTAFYEHFQEMRRRRKEASEWRRRDREQDKRWQSEHGGLTYGLWRRKQISRQNQNHNYDK